MTDPQYQSLSPQSGVNHVPWYWPNLTKDEATDLLMEHEHGDFLVRDSTTPGEYTMVVRKKQRVRNIRIHQGPKGYGVVADNCDFADVANLVEHLQNNPHVLHRLFPNIYLLNPVCKAEKADEETAYELLRQLVDKNKDCELHNSSYTNHVRRRELTLKELQLCKTKITSLKVVTSLFEDQLGLQSTELSSTMMKPAAEALSQEEESLALNRTAVHSRIQTVGIRLEQEESNLRELEASANQQLQEIELLHPQLLEMQQELTLLRLRVEEREIDRDYLDLLLKQEKNINLSHYNPEYWSVDCDSRGAVRLMADRVPGTFLVRPSSQGGHALSMVCALGENGAEVRHCMIYHNTNRDAYGFHQEYCIFSTIKELVIKHRTLSLKHYNRSLDVCLTYPVNYKHRLSGSEVSEGDD